MKGRVRLALFLGCGRVGGGWRVGTKRQLTAEECRSCLSSQSSYNPTYSGDSKVRLSTLTITTTQHVN